MNWKLTEVESLEIGDRVRTPYVTGFDADGKQIEEHEEFTVTDVDDYSGEVTIENIDGRVRCLPKENTIQKGTK